MNNITIDLENYWNFNKLSENHPLIKAAASCCLNNDQSKLYLFGGFDRNNKVSNELFVINTHGFSLENCINLEIEGRINHEMYFWNNCIIIIGGASFDFSKPLHLFEEIIFIQLPKYTIKTIPIKNIGSSGFKVYGFPYPTHPSGIEYQF
jgi:hypothetical protein